MTLLTPHFDLEEFACHDGTAVRENLIPRIHVLCEQLEIIREAFGGPLVVVSGYRTPEYNRRIGGAPRSQHIEGRAADVRPVRVGNVPMLYEMIEILLRDKRLPNIGGLGRYPHWVHVDVRVRPINGQVASWTGGKGIGSEPA